MTEIISSTERPVNDWTLERLESYALDRADEIGSFGRKTIVQTWLFGEALALICEKKKEDRGWMAWVDTQSFSMATASNAIKLCRAIAFEDLESCKEMTCSDLKASLGIIKEVPVKRRGEQKPVLLPKEQDTEKKISEGEDESAKAVSNDIPATKNQINDPDTCESNETTDSETEESDRCVKPTRSPRKKSEPAVGGTLTPSELLGKAFNLLLETEKGGITPDCYDLLQKIARKSAEMIDAMKVVAA